jgi:beta-galactosidase
VGVSWFSTSILVPADKAGKRVFLEFESVRFRAEVFVNRKLAGFDIIFGTGFKMDITNLLHFGKENQVAVRITDPDGNFTWTDFNYHQWGNYKIPPSHGFGGITGRVFLTYSEKVYFDDIFIRNKPVANSINAESSVINGTGKPVSGVVSYELFEDKELTLSCYKSSVRITLCNTENIVNHDIQLPNAKLWSPETPHLYYLKITWKGADGTTESSIKRFGFRWFEVVEDRGERYFALNGKRIVLRSSISWGYWPVNGIYQLRKWPKSRFCRLSKWD